MICTRCTSDGVLNSAGGSDFWYCRTCKDEIYPEVASSPPSQGIDWATPSVAIGAVDGANARYKTHTWNGIVDRCIECNMDGAYMVATNFPACPYYKGKPVSINRMTSATNGAVAGISSGSLAGITGKGQQVPSNKLGQASGATLCHHLATKIKFDNGPQTTEQCMNCGLSWIYQGGKK